MRPGDEYNCPNCGKNSFLKKESLMDGWTKKGEVLKCAACGQLVCELKAESESKTDLLKSDAANRLKDLFGGEEFIEKPSLEKQESEQHFCKDCIYLVPHPFKMRCAKQEKDVQPMDDCPHYQRRKP